MKNACLAAAWLIAVASPATADVIIESIQVQLYYQDSGRLSPPLTGKEALRNVVIGDGDAEEPSNATLVTVVLAGLRNNADENATVTLLVTGLDSLETFSKQEQRIGIFGNEGTYHAPFLLKNTGCEPLQLDASVSGVPGKKSKIINFDCGE